MRKLMTATIIVLPLILLAIMLVSGAIMSMVTHIYVESVEFTRNDDLILVMDDENNPPQYDISNELTILPLKATNRDLRFTTGDESLVKVNEDGILTAVFYGETYLTVQSYENKAAIAKRKIIVTDKSVHALRMVGGYKTELYEGQSQIMSVSVYPKEAENKLIKWRSSNESILHVGANGTITAVGAGTATVTAISDDNDKVTASAVITCHRKVNDLDVDQSLVVTSLEKTQFPEVTPIPRDAEVTCTYTSSDETIATVDNNGEITFKKEGHVTITVRATDFGGHYVEKSKEYTSTFGYYLPPLFKAKEYTVNYDQYSGKAPLPVEFTKAPVGAYREITKVDYSVENVLDFDKSNLQFTFKGEMPVGTAYIDVTVHADVYDSKTGTIDRKYEDGFRLNVERDATSVEFSYKGNKSTDIQTSQRTLTLTNDDAGRSSVINVSVTPKNHTNTIKYTLTDGKEHAKLEGNVLTFSETSSESSNVKITVTLETSSGTKSVEQTLTVRYVPIKGGEKEVAVDQTVHAMDVSLNYLGSENKDTGKITFSAPEGKTLQYKTEDKEIIKLESDSNGSYKITPLKGGFATVTITAVDSSTVKMIDGENDTWTIKVYVDVPVDPQDFEVKINDQEWNKDFRTSKGNFKYAVTVTDRNGSTEGKELSVKVGSKVAEKAVKGADRLTKSGTVEFEKLTNLTLTFEMLYGEEVPSDTKTNGVGEQTIVRTVTTSNGNLDKAPTVSYGEGEQKKELKAGETNEITIPNIGQSITLTVGDKFVPADFELSAHKPSLKSNDYVDATIADDGKTITLKGLKRTATDENKMQLSIGGKTFELKVKVCSLADKIDVVCGNETLTKDKEYKTLLSELKFFVTLSRVDGQNIDDKRVEYSFDGNTWKDVTADSSGYITVKFDTTYNGRLHFRSKDQGGAKIELQLEKTTLSDFKLTISYNDVESKKQELEVMENVKTNPQVSYILPGNMQPQLFLTLDFNESEYLGGVGDDGDFQDLFPLSFETSTWEKSYNPKDKTITVNIKVKDKSFSNKLILSHNNETIKVEMTFSRVNLGKIDFIGFDSGNSADLYRGYQQVRVFAKHSYYKTGENGTHQKVDYFKMPYKALADVKDNAQEVDPSIVTWKLYKVVGNDTPVLLVEQKGTNVTYYAGGGETVEYIIEKAEEGGTEYVLKNKSSGTATDETIPWIDVLSESGYARIHFGNFLGLSESDIQNDYFGNFDDSTDYKKKDEATDDKSGREFKPSPGAYSFLKVEASDGSEKGVNRHFNFNVLEDNDVFNVFDAEGYYAKKKVVLHNDLYGGKFTEYSESNPNKPNIKFNVDEVTKTSENEAQFITETNTSKLDKTLIIGNGNSVSFNALNAYGVLHQDQGYGSINVHLENIINATVKGSNPVDQMYKNNHVMVLIPKYAYYCDIQYYSKMSPWGAGSSTSGIVYLKNTVLRNAAQSALQLYYNASTAYIENVVQVECVGGFTADSTEAKYNVVFNLKGFVDVLNYMSYSMLESATNMTGLMDLYGFTDLLAKCDNYLEWFGKTPDEVSNSYYKPWVKSRFANVFIYNRSRANMGSTLTLKFWDENSKEFSSENKELSNGVKIVAPLDADDMFQSAHYAIYAYDYTTDKDGGKYDESKKKYTDRNMDQLFTKDRYTRLLCQYLDIIGDDKDKTPIKNYEHILWHTQQVYRDLTIIERIEDHEEALKESLKNATKQQGDIQAAWDGIWPDSTTLDDALKASESETENVINMLGDVILPEKREYC